MKTRVDESGRSKRKQKRNSPVQMLYDTCAEVFAGCGPGVIPPPDKVERLAAVLDGMTQEDVGLRPNMSFFSSKRGPTISYLHLHKCDNFSMGVFCLPPSSVIPLHNHPGMTVFSKILFGTMHIKAYDWLIDADENNNGTSINPSAPETQVDGLHLAKLKVDSDFTAPCKTSILYPSDGGNMHCFTAKTACAVLDVLGPPYCDPDGRHCQYYYEFPVSTFPVDGLLVDEDAKYAWLAESEKPEDLCVVGVPYVGPKIVQKLV